MLFVEISWKRDDYKAGYAIDVYREVAFVHPHKIPVNINMTRTYKGISRASVTRLVELVLKRGGRVSENENGSYGTGFYKRGW